MACNSPDRHSDHCRSGAYQSSDQERLLWSHRISQPYITSSHDHGIAIPFGIFRKAVDMPYPPGSTTNFFEWLQSEYRAIAVSPFTREQQTRKMLKRARRAILTIQFSSSFISELCAALSTNIGPIGSYGVFVRSDSNVEYIPSFTGSGLNLTVPNVTKVVFLSFVWLLVTWKVGPRYNDSLTRNGVIGAEEPVVRK